MSEFALSSAHYAVNSNPVQPPSSGPEWYTSSSASSSALAGKGPNAPSATGAAMTGAGMMRGGDRGAPAMTTTGMMGMGSYGGDTTNYAFDPAAIGTSGASYGSFEDEAPLLEGENDAVWDSSYRIRTPIRPKERVTGTDAHVQ